MNEPSETIFTGPTRSRSSPRPVRMPRSSPNQDRSLNPSTSCSVVQYGISKQDIENMGARTLLQVLDNLPAARPAQVDSKSLFTGSDGASQANLRGLGAQGTLVLLNGRRLSYYGAPAGFQTQFVNIDSIPAAAIERMEVLTDGASAVYGTDAVAGVINVITKREYRGAEISLTTDFAPRFDSYGEHQLSFTGGFGDLDEDRYNVYGSVNLYRRDPIPLSEWYDKKPDQFYVNNPSYINNLRLGTGSAPGVFNPGSYFAINPVTGRRTRCKNTRSRHHFTSSFRILNTVAAYRMKYASNISSPFLQRQCARHSPSGHD